MPISKRPTRSSKSPKERASTVRFVAAPFTPMDQDGNILLKNIPPMADFLYSQGVSGVFVCGTTGEGMSLTLKERKTVTEAWMACSRRRLEVIAHVGHTCLADARDLAAHAEAKKVDAVASIAPTFFRAATPRDLAAYCAQIASAAPNRKFYYYHMPSMAPVGFKASEVFPLLRKGIPNFAGIKFTHDDLEDYRRCLKLAGSRYEIFFGRDELLLEGLKAGARSAVGSTYNFGMPLYRGIAEAVAAREMKRAAQLQRIATEGIETMVRHGGLPAIKEVMSLVSKVECGNVRLPLSFARSAKSPVLKRELKASGYLAALAVTKIA